MIAYAMLEEEEIPRQAPQKVLVPAKNTAQKNQTTECNTLVMIFIGSVLFLALLDTTK